MRKESSVDESQTTTAVEENSPAVTPAVEPTTSVDTTDVTPSTEVQAPVVSEAPAVEAERPPRAERRIQELSAKLREATAQPQYMPSSSQSPTAPKLSELLAGQETIDPAELDKLGQQMYQQGAQTSQGYNSLEVQALRAELAQKDAVNNYSSDERNLPTMFDELNPNSKSYSDLLDGKIAREYQARAVRLDAQGRTWIDPSVKLADIAAENVELARASAEHGRAQTATNLRTQADNSAVTPTSEAVAPSKSFDDMSLKEQETYLRAKGHNI